MARKDDARRAARPFPTMAILGH